MILKDLIKQKIIEILTQFEDRVLTGFKPFDDFNQLATGDQIWTVATPDGQDTNIILLSDINKDCIDAFNELKNDGIIGLRNCDPFIAMVEGDIYKLPFPKSIKVYKSPRWLPTLVYRGKNWIKYKKSEL